MAFRKYEKLWELPEKFLEKHPLDAVLARHGGNSHLSTGMDFAT